MNKPSDFAQASAAAALGRNMWLMVDTETTGLKPADGARIIQFGYILAENDGKRTLQIRRGESLIKPDTDYWHERAQQEHGLDREHVMKYGSGPSMIPSMLNRYIAEFGDDLAIFAWNADFDQPMLKQAGFNGEVLCAMKATMALASRFKMADPLIGKIQERLGGNGERIKLDECGAVFAPNFVSVGLRHTALYDSELALAVLSEVVGMTGGAE